MKTYEKLIEELMESTPANAMNGNFSNAQVGTAGGIAGYSPVMGFGRRKKRKIREMFAGCPVFNVGSGDYAKCMHGRMKYERWNKKMDMHEMDNQEIRTYAHRNPGKPIIIKDSTYGTMSYFVPPKKELDESLGGPGGPSREMSPNDMYTSGLRTKALLKKLQDKTTAAKYNKLADKLDKLKKKKRK